jgi:hypothetical protein
MGGDEHGFYAGIWGSRRGSHGDRQAAVTGQAALRATWREVGCAERWQLRDRARAGLKKKSDSSSRSGRRWRARVGSMRFLALSILLRILP